MCTGITGDVYVLFGYRGKYSAYCRDDVYLPNILFHES